jgi:hypothetical protein
MHKQFRVTGTVYDEKDEAVNFAQEFVTHCREEHESLKLISDWIRRCNKRLCNIVIKPVRSVIVLD